MELGVGVGGVGVEGSGVESRGWGKWGQGVGVRKLRSGGCSWFACTIKVLQLIYKYLVVSCAVFNYLVLGLKWS